MASLDHYGNVIYVGTLSKALVPAARIGFMAGPENFIQLAAKRRSLIDFQGDAFMELALAGLFRSGAVSRHINKSVRVYRQRRGYFCGVVGGLGGRGGIWGAGGGGGGWGEGG